MRNNLALSMALVITLMVISAQTSDGQTFNVIHAFSGGTDGAYPFAGVIIDAAGDLYGTTAHGGDRRCGCGTAYKLKHTGSGWLLTPLYTFKGSDHGDGASPTTRLTIGPNGTLYGTTGEGGAYGVGTVFSLRIPARATGNILGGWTENVLYQFGQQDGDGGYPSGTLIFDHLGNIYGTNTIGGLNQAGTVFELTYSGGGWVERTIYDFSSGGGGQPYAGLVLDSSGNLYGSTFGYGYLADGTVFELSPSGSGWAENTLYAFRGGSDGQNPHGGVIFDQFGNLYGTAAYGGSGNGGTVFKLTNMNGSYTFDLLYSLTGAGSAGPVGSLTMDAAGNLYGATAKDGAYGYGSIFKLIPNGEGNWTYVDLHDFTGESDGEYPLDGVTLDSNGNIFGTASDVSDLGYGVVFEITP